MRTCPIWLVWLLCLLLAACGSSSPTGPYFEHAMFFDRDVSNADVASNSDSLIAGLSAAGGWGYGNRFRIDFSFDVLHADATTPHREFVPLADAFYTPDCDQAAVPVPVQGNLEGESDYACTGGGDCHLLVMDDSTGTLFEMYRADMSSGFTGGCLAVWDTHRDYGDTLRGDECASADAAGLPIAPLLFTADEVAAGSIDHAIRFVLPNDRVRHGFVRPATHGSDTDGASNAPPYGIHLRLKAGYPVDTLPTPGARVVAKALQTYGMVHADGGEITLTAASDRYTTSTWDGLLGEDDLEALRVEDFEVIDHGAPIAYPYHCER